MFRQELKYHQQSYGVAKKPLAVILSCKGALSLHTTQLCTPGSRILLKQMALQSVPDYVWKELRDTIYDLYIGQNKSQAEIVQLLSQPPISLQVTLGSFHSFLCLITTSLTLADPLNLNELLLKCLGYRRI
jgi:Clr5-like protein